MEPTTRRGLTEAERFWAKVDILGNCWLWVAYTGTCVSSLRPCR